MGLDLRYALRLLARRPLFTLAVVITIGPGIASTTTVFSLVDGVLLDPLPYAKPEALVSVWEHQYARDRDRNVVSPANFLAWRDEGVFDGLAAVVAAGGTVTGDGEPERVGVITASASFFPLLGITAATGRVYGPEEDAPEAARVVVLGHGFWQRRFGADPGVVGRTLTLNDGAATIVGVLPRDFSFEFGASFGSVGRTWSASS